jgi:hypothetical protein
VAASGLCLGGEQKRMRTGLHQTGPEHVSVPDPRLGPAQGPCMFGLGTPLWVAQTPYRGGGGVSGPILGVRLAHVEVLDQPWGSELCIHRSGALPWGSGLTVDALEYITFFKHMAALGLPM